MSKRFGRNQKRKINLQLAAVKSISARIAGNLDRSEEQRRGQRAEIVQLEESIKLTAAILGDAFIGLPPESYDMRVLRERFGNEFLIHKQGKAEFHVTSMPVTVAASFVETCLHLPIMDTKVFLDKLVNQVHVRLEFEGKHLTYAVSLDALKGAPKEYIVQRVSKELARSLVDRFREEGIG